MNNLKRDLLEELVRDKGYLEMELSGLAQNPIISYREKVIKMKECLNEIAVINGTFGLIDIYFPESKVEQPVPEPTVQAPVPEPVPEQVPEPVQAPVPEPVVETPVEVVNEPVVDKTSPFPKIN